jgi:myo-inositol 2-dehydrogenase/D-chiro-inositol 1-dehydrogenase
MTDIAIIGAGRIGRIHARNGAAQGLRLKYVVDTAPGAAAELAAATQSRAASLDEVFSDPSIEGVVIASATDTHLPYSIRAIEAGKAVFCEKPIDQDLARARAASGKLGAPGVRLFLGFNRRFDPHFQALKARLEAGEAGRLETLHITSHDPAPPPIAYVKVSGGLFKDMAIHDFDMARWLLGEEPAEVFAAGSCLVDPAIGEAGDVDTARTLLRTPSGRICVISNTRRSGYGYDQRIEAFGSEGVLRADNVLESTVSLWGPDGGRGDALQNFFLDRYAQAYRREMAHFAAVVRGEARPAVGYADGVAALALAQAAQQSCRENAVVRLDHRSGGNP